MMNVGLLTLTLFFTLASIASGDEGSLDTLIRKELKREIGELFDRGSHIFALSDVKTPSGENLENLEYKITDEGSDGSWFDVEVKVNQKISVDYRFHRQNGLHLRGLFLEHRSSTKLLEPESQSKVMSESRAIELAQLAVEVIYPTKGSEFTTKETAGAFYQTSAPRHARGEPERWTPGVWGVSLRRRNSASGIVFDKDAVSVFVVDGHGIEKVFWKADTSYNEAPEIKLTEAQAVERATEEAQITLEKSIAFREFLPDGSELVSKSGFAQYHQPFIRMPNKPRAFSQYREAVKERGSAKAVWIVLHQIKIPKNAEMNETQIASYIDVESGAYRGGHINFR